jgi:hypothetical protein
LYRVYVIIIISSLICWLKNSKAKYRNKHSTVKNAAGILYCEADAGVVPQTRPRPLPSTFFPTHNTI